MKAGDVPTELEKKVTLLRPMPVYAMYLTAEKSSTGAMRFVDDVYGQDVRLAKSIGVSKSAKASSAGAIEGYGTLVVEGTAGSSQKFQTVKAIRCDVEQRGACDAPILLNHLNESKSVPAGSYILSFENTIYPDIVEVSANRVTRLSLEKRMLPESLRGKKIRVYRDFTSRVEQQKILQTMFYMKHHLQRLDKDNFGGLYEAGNWERDFVQRFSYEFCSKIEAVNSYSPVEPEALEKCSAWNSASQPEDLSSLFQFNADGTFDEFWVTAPGDVIPSRHPRYLVSAPTTGGDFVSVFPGDYKYQVEGESKEYILSK